MAPAPAIEWVVLTRGDRPAELEAALASLAPAPVVVVWNGAPPLDLPGIRSVRSERNLGVPGGRSFGVASTSAELIGFLDDDAVLHPWSAELAISAFDDPTVGVVGFRIVDEEGNTSRRHVPRVGRLGMNRSGPVATFLGGACIIRRAAWDEVGGYYDDLFYGHEELDLSWRMIDAGWTVRYEANATMFHPRTSISRHADGWRLTGRNRVLVARRNLPCPLHLLHSAIWLAIGLLRAPTPAIRRAYLDGWKAGRRHVVEPTPVRWTTVARLARLGRPPIV